MPFLVSAWGLLLVVLSLPACGSSGRMLSEVFASTTEFVPGSAGIGKPPGAVEMRYTLGQRAHVRVEVTGATVPGDSSVLFEGDQAVGMHVVRFNGVISATVAAGNAGDAGVVREALPPGDYFIKVTADSASERLPVKLAGGVAQSPALENIVMKPEVISPNSDAVDDVAELTFRTNQSVTLSVDLTSADGTHTPVLAPVLKGAGEQNVVVSGLDLLGNVLADGEYTVTLRAQDKAGNRVEADRKLTLEGSGIPAIQVLKVDISPQQVMLGQAISVTITVKNVGNTPLRTQGPLMGYTYTTNDSYSSIEGGKYVDKAGLWRVGVDWDGNSGGGPSYRYPFRWGFDHTLLPGETAVTGGRITILKQERTMWFYAGVLQEGIRIVWDRLGRKRVGVGF